jgi:3-keto-5-aminohexanoate cleavage enzyme
MPTRKTWLEVALNGGWTRKIQPGIPVAIREIVAEGVECVRAGAAIVHLHAYDETTGRQKDDAEIYAAIIDGIRAEVDAIVYPTLPIADATIAAPQERARRRFAAIETLAAQGKLEWTVVDPGSVNFAHVDAIAADRPGSVYVNAEADIRLGLELAARHRFHPSYACYEPGFVRLGAALHRRYPAAPMPIYRLMFSDAFAFGFPPEAFALDAYRALLERVAPAAPWMIAGLGVDILPLVPAAVAAGGHVRVGLEDAPLGTPLGNVGWVERAADAIAHAGGTPATAAEVRAALSEAR